MVSIFKIALAIYENIQKQKKQRDNIQEKLKREKNLSDNGVVC